MPICGTQCPNVPGNGPFWPVWVGSPFQLVIYFQSLTGDLRLAEGMHSVPLISPSKQKRGRNLMRASFGQLHDTRWERGLALLIVILTMTGFAFAQSRKI